MIYKNENNKAMYVFSCEYLPHDYVVEENRQMFLLLNKNKLTSDVLWNSGEMLSISNLHITFYYKRI